MGAEDRLVPAHVVGRAQGDVVGLDAHRLGVLQTARGVRCNVGGSRASYGDDTGKRTITVAVRQVSLSSRLARRRLLVFVAISVLAAGCDQSIRPSEAPGRTQSAPETPSASIIGLRPTPMPATPSPTAATASVAWHSMQFPDEAYVIDASFGPGGLIAIADCPKCGATPATA